MPDPKTFDWVGADPFFKRLRGILQQRSPRRSPWTNFTSAAVLIPLWREHGIVTILFTKRSDSVRHHKGEVSFPGGVREPQDPDLSHTALREAQEEVGIPTQDVSILGPLDEAFSLSRFSIWPFVGALRRRPSLMINREVAKPLILPLHRFLEPDSLTQSQAELDGIPVPILTFNVDDVTVWGATARILTTLLDLIKGDEVLLKGLKHSNRP